jgi:hypothetical protein
MCHHDAVVRNQKHSDFDAQTRALKQWRNKQQAQLYHRAKRPCWLDASFNGIRGKANNGSRSGKIL